MVDGVGQVWGEGEAVLEQEGLGWGGGAPGGSGGGDVGGAAGGGWVRRGVGDLADGAGDGLQVAVDDFGEDAVQADEVALDGLAGHADGEGEVGQSEGGAAVAGHEHGGSGDDAVPTVQLTRGEVGAVAGEVVGLGSELPGVEKGHGWGL